MGVSLATERAGAHHGYDTIFETPRTPQNCPEEKTTFCLADNTSHTVYVGYLGPMLEAATRWTLDNRYQNTDLNIAYEATPDLTGSSETDTIYVTCQGQTACGFPFASTYGRTWCDDDVDGGVRCDQHYVKYRSDYFLSQYGDYFTGTRQATWHESTCHETGL